MDYEINVMMEQPPNSFWRSISNKVFDIHGAFNSIPGGGGGGAEN